jgi:hypothetical protein
VTVLDTQTKRQISLSFAGIVLEPATGSAATKDETLVPSPVIGRREDFRVGQRVSFTDADLQHRVGVIVRINQRPPPCPAMVATGAYPSRYCVT